VWALKVRQKLVKNIVQGKPIPAIFLYKEPAGSKYSYNILDGKQRLESIILFVGNERPDWSIPAWKKYFFSEKLRKDVGFKVQLSGGKSTFVELDDAAIRELREYSIPTIEITLNDESTLDDMISLFVDINQYGVKVNRFDIVKAMGRNDPLLMDVFALIADEQKRGEDIFYRTKRTPFTNIRNRCCRSRPRPQGLGETVEPRSGPLDITIAAYRLWRWSTDVRPHSRRKCLRANRSR